MGFSRPQLPSLGVFGGETVGGPQIWHNGGGVQKRRAYRQWKMAIFDGHFVFFRMLGLSENRVYPQWNSHLVGIIWVNYNELTTSSLEIIVSKGNHPQMALIQVSELL